MRALAHPVDQADELLALGRGPTQTRSQTNFSCGVQRESDETEHGSSSETGAIGCWLLAPVGAMNSVSARRMGEGRMINPAELIQLC